MGAAGLNLIFDTSVFINDNGLDVFKSLYNDETGTLPEPVRLFIPYAVRRELHNMSKGKKKKSQEAAETAYLYLTDIPADDPTVEFQTKRDAKQAQNDLYPPHAGPYRSLNDGMILVYSLLIKSRYDDTDAETWLVTNDNQLIARSVRSGVVGMTLAVLKKAMRLEVYSRSDPMEDAYYALDITSESDNGSQASSSSYDDDSYEDDVGAMDNSYGKLFL